jgi:LysR family glycine cleavage system transcriptional activator
MSSLAKLIPSPRALMIFEAAARAGSCGAAAREFNLTQPSVSRNIAGLEAHIGVPLFTRSPRGLTLTDEGAVLQRALEDGFQKVADAIQELMDRRNRKQVVELSLSTAFVTHWLIPRLAEFQRAFPEVDLRFQLIAGTLRGGPGVVDLAMRMEAENAADHHSWPFAPELIVPVCSPSYLKAHGPLDKAKRDARHTLLHFADPLLDWDRLWGGMVSRRTPNKTWIEFSDYAVVVQAAMNGEGIAPGWITVVSRALCQGMLVPVCETRIRTGHSYHLVASRGRPVRQVTLAICDWLTGRMRQDMEQLGPLLAE